VSNLKFRYSARGEQKRLINRLSKEIMTKVRLTSKVVGQKCRQGIIHKICNQNGYVWTPENERVTPTEARDHSEWYKDIWGDCENLSLPVILIEQVLNRYQSYKKRNGHWPKYVEFKKDRINIKKNYIRYDDTLNRLYIRDLHGVKIELQVDNSRSVLTHKDIFLKQLNKKKKQEKSPLTTVQFAANMIFDQRQIIPIVTIEQEEIYSPAEGKFFAVDINQSTKDWLTFNIPINGHKAYPKPDSIKEAEQRIQAIETAINATFALKPNERRGKTVKVKHPDFEEMVFKCTSDGRRRLRLYWKDAHKKHKKEIKNCLGLKQIEKFIIENKLGYAHDNIGPGKQRGTFGQDKLGEYWEKRAKEIGFPFEKVNPSFTSRECPECGDQSKKNRKKDEFKCVNCGYENESHIVGAINIGRKAQRAYSDRSQVSDPE